LKKVSVTFIIMPFYQYYCQQNQLTVEVSHTISKRLKTWGEVCERAGIAPGDTPFDAPVTRLISKPMPVVWRLKGLDKDEPGDRMVL